MGAQSNFVVGVGINESEIRTRLYCCKHFV